MKRLRERRRRGWTRVIGVEVTARDAATLWERGFFHDHESAATDLPIALRRLIDSIR